ncbi:hypothetical protein LC55x_0388 [Lysobacter capsici]|nr:hypothetical protein LC55x_0388 [Lysobacter capsici]
MHVDGQCHCGSAELRETVARQRGRSAEGWDDTGILGGACRGSRSYGLIHIVSRERRPPRSASVCTVAAPALSMAAAQPLRAMARMDPRAGVPCNRLRTCRDSTSPLSAGTCACSTPCGALRTKRKTRLTGRRATSRWRVPRPALSQAAPGQNSWSAPIRKT